MPKQLYKFGDLIRCKRCAKTYEIMICGDCSEQHPKTVDVPSNMVVDHLEEFCVYCVTPEEAFHTMMQTHMRMHTGSAPN